VKAGRLAGLSRSVLATYLVLAAHGNRQFKCNPTVATIAKLSGFSERQAQRAIKTLERVALVRVCPGGGRKQPSTYELLANGDIDNVGVWEPANGDNREQKFRREQAQAVTSRNAKGDIAERKPRHVDVTRTTGTTLTTSTDDPTGHVVNGIRYGLFDDQGERPAGGDSRTNLPKRPRDELWDVLVELFKISNPSKAERTRLGRVASDLRAKGATPEEIRNAYQRANTEWEGKPFSLEALAKWFDQFRRPSTNRGPARITAPAGKYVGVSNRIEVGDPGKANHPAADRAGSQSGGDAAS
jgi:hypothetical protein